MLVKVRAIEVDENRSYGNLPQLWWEPLGAAFQRVGQPSFLLNGLLTVGHGREWCVLCVFRLHQENPEKQCVSYCCCHRDRQTIRRGKKALYGHDLRISSPAWWERIMPWTQGCCSWGSRKGNFNTQLALSFLLFWFSLVYLGCYCPPWGWVSRLLTQNSLGKQPQEAPRHVLHWCPRCFSFFTQVEFQN